MAERPSAITMTIAKDGEAAYAMDLVRWMAEAKAYMDALEAERDDLRAKLATTRAALWLIVEAKVLGPGVRFALSDARTAASEALAATEKEA